MKKLLKCPQFLTQTILREMKRKINEKILFTIFLYYLFFALNIKNFLNIYPYNIFINHFCKGG